MLALDAERLKHIQTHCRDILYDLERSAQTYAEFADQPNLLEYMRVQLYHVGELAEGLTDAFLALPQDNIAWSAVRLWAHLRTCRAENLDSLWLWYTVSEEVPKLLQYCCEITAACVES